MNSIFRFAAAPLIGVVVVLGLVVGSLASEEQNKDTSSVENVESNLTFNDVTLEQADEQGRSVWKVKAEEATYSKDKLLKFRSQPVNYSKMANRFTKSSQQGSSRMASSCFSRVNCSNRSQWLGVAWQ